MGQRDCVVGATNPQVVVVGRRRSERSSAERRRHIRAAACALALLFLVSACRQETTLDRAGAQPNPDIAVTLPIGPISLLSQAPAELVAQEDTVVVHVVFEIGGIERIHQGTDDTMRNQALAAAQEFLRQESLEDFDFIVDFVGLDGGLEAYSTEPIVIRDAESWVSGANQRWRESAESVFGKDCSPNVVLEFTQ